MHLNRIKLSCKRGSRPDAADRVTQLKYTKSDGNVIDQIDYTYDAAGQRISKTMLNGNSAPETPMSATFDAGNRMQTITLNPNKPEQKIYTLTYDNNGNLTKKQLSTDANCTIDCTDYVWDSRNRLVQIKQNQTTSATYSYDAENRRIQTNITTNGTTNQVSYIDAGSQSVGEVRNQQLSHSLMTGLQMDEHIARIALNQGATPQVKTYLTDALGSVIAIAKADQSLDVGYAFSPYGQTQKVGVENQLAGSENSSQYTGRENDNNGLYFYRARYYDPVLKRFISEDPIGLAGGINSHAYVEGDPVSLTDPKGEYGVPGALGSAAFNFAVQFSVNYYKTGDASKSFKCIDFSDVVVSGVMGFFGPGVLGNIIMGKAGPANLGRGLETALWALTTLPAGAAWKKATPSWRIGDQCECKDVDTKSLLSLIAH